MDRALVPFRNQRGEYICPQLGCSARTHSGQELQLHIRTEHARVQDRRVHDDSECSALACSQCLTFQFDPTLWPDGQEYPSRIPDTFCSPDPPHRPHFVPHDTPGHCVLTDDSDGEQDSAAISRPIEQDSAPINQVLHKWTTATHARPFVRTRPRLRPKLISP